ncbi:hypothetical protein DRO97_01175 [Archaeoglobales archaeon]|nr:MAG: hypothetical protein DRO97_01175 [Archaeoglobales archaeon]
MDYLVLTLGIATVLFACGVLLTRDNLYASLYMSVTLILIATIYTVYSIQSVFVLITFIFVGAIGIITIALAATYRFIPARKISVYWLIPIAIVTAIVAYTYYLYSGQIGIVFIKEHSFASFPTEYLLMVVFLVSLMALLMLSAIKLVRGEGS